MLLNQASLDMEYNFGTGTQSASNNETNLSVSNSCDTMYAALSFRVGLPLSLLRQCNTKISYAFFFLIVDVQIAILHVI